MKGSLLNHHQCAASTWMIIHFSRYISIFQISASAHKFVCLADMFNTFILTVLRMAVPELTALTFSLFIVCSYCLTVLSNTDRSLSSPHYAAHICPLSYSCHFHRVLVCKMSVTLALVEKGKKKDYQCTQIFQITCLVGYSVYFLFIYIYLIISLFVKNTVIGLQNQEVVI